MENIVVNTQHCIIMFEFCLNVIFPLLCLLQFLGALKNDFIRQRIDVKIQCFHVNDLKSTILRRVPL
jgi:hypothetical protein